MAMEGLGIERDGRQAHLMDWWVQAESRLKPEAIDELVGWLQRLVAAKRAGRPATAVWSDEVLQGFAMLLSDADFPEGDEWRLGFVAAFEHGLPPRIRPSWRGMAVVAVKGKDALRRQLREAVSAPGWLRAAACAAPDLPPVPEAAFPGSAAAAGSEPRRQRCTARRTALRERIAGRAVAAASRSGPYLSCDWAVATEDPEEAHATGAAQVLPSVEEGLEVEPPCVPGAARAMLRRDLVIAARAARASVASGLSRPRLRLSQAPPPKRRDRRLAEGARRSTAAGGW